MNMPIETRAFASAALLMVVILLLAPQAVPWTVQLAALALGVVVLGLPHGALDPMIARHAGLVHSKRSLLVFNAIYSLVVVMVVVLWWFAPVFSLAIFLAVSAWHFSGDWRFELPWWGQGIGGAGLLLLPITFHTGEVAVIFEALSGPGGATLAHQLATLGGLVPAAMLAVGLYAAWRHQWATAIEFAALIAIGFVAPPLVFFIVYFCLLHSPRHILGHFQQTPSSEHGALWRMLVVYTLGTLVLLAPLLWLWSSLSVSETILRLVFVGLAAVTVPHMLLMAYSERKTPSTQC